MAKSYLTPNEVAELLRVSTVTLRQWAQKGLIEATTTAGGHRRFTMDAVRRFAAERGITLVVASDGPTRILVVDDERPFNRLLVAYLENARADLVVDSAYDGFDAGRKVQQQRPEVILLDIMMPGMNGIEVCERIKSDPETASAVVIAMTGHYTPELASRIVNAGAMTLLKKPFSMEELIATLEGSGVEF